MLIRFIESTRKDIFIEIFDQKIVLIKFDLIIPQQKDKSRQHLFYALSWNFDELFLYVLQIDVLMK